MTRYDFHNGALWNPSFPILRRQFPSRFHCIAVVGLTGQTASKYRHNREPNLVKKWIGQKIAIRQWQVLRKFYDDAIEVLLKFCDDAIASRSIFHPTIVDNQRGDARSYIANCSVDFAIRRACITTASGGHEPEKLG